MEVLYHSEPIRDNWSEFNTDHFPNVGVRLTGCPKNEKDFDTFLKQWLDLYASGEKFSIYFDTTDVGFVSMKYAFKMKSFINRLKGSIKYSNGMTHSLIKVKSNWVKFLLRMIFAFEKPVAPVYIYADEKVENKLLESIRENKPVPRGVRYIEP